MDRALTGAAPHLRDPAGGQVRDPGMMDKRKANRRIGLILASVVLAFFIGIMIKTAILGQ